MNNLQIIGARVDLTGNKGTLEKITTYNFERSGYICVLGLKDFFECYTNEELLKAFNNSFLNPMHSPYIKILIKYKGLNNTTTLDPAWLMEELLKTGLNHYFYGSNEKTLNKIKSHISSCYPDAQILGYKSPPMVGFDELKYNKSLEKDFIDINKLKPNIVWIGLGGVKQDLIMYYYSNLLPNSLMIGVGAVFDVFAGNIKLRPQWVKKAGLSWLYYLLQQPVYRTKAIFNFISKILFKAIKKKIHKKKITKVN